MNATVVALLGLTLTQPPAADYYPLKARTITLPIEYKKDRKAIRQTELFVCENGDQVWKQVAAVPPTQDSFSYTAPADGLYWFHIVIVDLKGGRDPANLTAEAPAMKVLVDTTTPLVTFTSAKRAGDDAVVEWRIDDKFPNDAATRVYFRPTTSGPEEWREVTLPAGSKTGVRFPAGPAGPVLVKVTVADLAGNTGEGTKEVAVGGGGIQTVASLSPAAPSPLAAVPPPPTGLAPPDALAPPPGTGPVAPPGPAPMVPPVAFAPPPAPTIAPLATTTPPPVMSPTPPPAAPLAMTAPPVVPATPAAPAGPQAVATFDPRNPGPVTPASAGFPAPPAPAPGGPMIEVSRAQVINTVRFDLNYQVEQRGPSGISRVDLWVTRDDGRTWVWWSQHNGQETPVKANLATQSNATPEGLYGFRVVPVSGAGLSEATPVAGDAPDIRVVVDVTPPAVKMFPATSDATYPDALLIRWEATDKNFGDDPITLEWSDTPTGPWRPVAAAGSEGVVQVGAVAATLARRLPNTGSYPWRVPAGLPPRVYMKVTARDAAGNTTEQVTREPVLIDLTKPRAKITGIGAGPVVGRP